MAAAGTDRVRLTPHQKLVVLDVARAPSTTSSPGSTRSASRCPPARSAAHTMACTGIEFCKLAIVETKATAATAIAELERRLADVTDRLDTPVTLNVNGCPNSCARIQVADIGLKGKIVTDATASRRPASRCTSAAGSPPRTATRPASAAPCAA